MLNDEDAINDVNPFVSHDFSLPGGVRQTGNFEDFTEMRNEPGIPEKERVSTVTMVCVLNLRVPVLYLDQFTHEETLTLVSQRMIESLLSALLSVSPRIQSSPLWGLSSAFWLLL